MRAVLWSREGEWTGLYSALSQRGHDMSRAQSLAQLAVCLHDESVDLCLLSADGGESSLAARIESIRAAAPLALIALLPESGETEQKLLLGVDLVVDVTLGDEGVSEELELAQKRRADYLSEPDTFTKRVLIVDDQDSPELLRPLVVALERAGFTVDVEQDVLRALAHLRRRRTHVLLGDPGSHLRYATELFGAARRFDQRVMPLVMTELSTVGRALSALEHSAVDFLFKPVNVPQAVRAIQTAWQRWDIENERVGVPSGAARIWRVLLVEDGDVDAALTTAQLARLSTSVVTRARSLAEAVGILGSGDKFDLVVSDLGLPDSNGLETFLRLRTLCSTTPIIVLTGEEDDALAQQAISYGAQDFIPKGNIKHGLLTLRAHFALQRHARVQSVERLAQDLYARDASLRQLITRSADGIVVLDKEHRVLFANPAAEGLFERSQSSWLGQPFGYELSDGPLTEIELPSHSPESARIAELRLVETEWNGHPALLATLRDTSARRQAEFLRARLDQSEQLAAIGQLAAGVTHEINNPAAFVVANLNAMKEQVALLQRCSGQLRESGAMSLPSSVSAQLDQAVTEIGEMLGENIEGMERIRTITRDLRTFARIERDEVEWVSLNELVEAACSFASHEIRHRARLKKELAELPRIAAARGKLTQVVTNLLVNAAQAIVEGDADHNLISITTCQRGEQVVLRVEDSGSGIQPENMARIFEPFFTTKSRDQGTGLGLSLCADLVGQHGGELKVESTPGQGSVFEVRLPQHTGWVSVARPKSLPPPSQTPLASLRVLLIDDEPLVLRAYSRMLKGHDLVLAQGGAVGLACLEKDASFDIILSDLMMPDLDGPLLYEAIEKSHPELLERLVFCSGGAFTQRARDFLESIDNVVLEKPLTRRAFEATARRLLHEPAKTSGFRQKATGSKLKSG